MRRRTSKSPYNRIVLIAAVCIVTFLVKMMSNGALSETKYAGTPNEPRQSVTQTEQSAAGDAEKLYYYALNVGQGDSTLIVFPNGQNMLVDAGTAESAYYISSFLKGLKIKKIDYLVATHPHADHIGGIVSVMKDFEIGQVWDSGYNHGSKTQRDFYKLIQSRKIPYGKPKAGYKTEIGGADVEVLAPVRELSDPNNNSIVIRIEYGKTGFLLTGDMEKAERETVGTFPQTTVLKIAHHGGVSGTDEKFLRQVNPRVATFSYETGNSYGHPHAEVKQLIAKYNIIRFDTPNGTIGIATDGTKLYYDESKIVKYDPSEDKGRNRKSSNYNQTRSSNSRNKNYNNSKSNSKKRGNYSNGMK